MNSFRRIFRKSMLAAALFLAVMFWPAQSIWAQGADPNERDMAFEAEVLAQLEALQPQAVPIFRAATANMDAGNYQSALDGFVKVLELAPDFPAALRRLAYCEVALEQYQAAEGHARQALAIEPASYNQTALAVALLNQQGAAQAAEALQLVRQAVAADPDDVRLNMS